VIVPIPNLPGYRADDEGFIWSCRLNSGRLGQQWKKLRGSVQHAGHIRVRITRNGIRERDSARLRQRRMTAEEIRSMRSEYVRGSCGYKTLAKKYRTSWQNVRQIVHGKAWKSVMSREWKGELPKA